MKQEPTLARFYCDSIIQGQVQLEPDQSHHLANVLRLEPGQPVVLFDGKGTLAQAVITDIKRKAVMLEVEDILKEDARTTGRVIIAVSIAKGQKFDWVITKCTELGVDHIAAAVFERTVKLAKGPSVLDRYNKLALAATKQCGRVFLPKITGPCDLAGTLSALQKDYPEARLVFGTLNPEAKRICKLPTSDEDIIAFVGPEGGLTNGEQEQLRAADGLEVQLTDTTLRIETAAFAFAAILCANRDAAG
jgi:16S rRNA (uracil1498-N3)-methyltransferase